MNSALIFAGGTGQRMNTRAKPKQFLDLHGKPILLYTLDHFEDHREIEDIAVVCLESWIDELKRLLKRYDFKKVSYIIPGGATGHESIYEGLKAWQGIRREDDIVLIHDGVRPLINGELITANIVSVKEHGTAITAESAAESVVRSVDGHLIESVPTRSQMFIAKAPQSFYYGRIWELYRQAHRDGFLTIDSAHLLSLYGQKMHLVKSPPNNMKITAPSDYYVFRALYEAIENRQILGI